MRTNKKKPLIRGSRQSGLWAAAIEGHTVKHIPRRHYRLRIPALVVVLFPLVVLPESAARAQQDRPNVVIFVVDDARVDDLSSMPIVQSLIADEGATFTNAFAPFPLCCPARATLLTGQYAHNHGVLGNSAPQGGFHAFDDSQTLATWLNDTYTTGFVGKYLNAYGSKGTSTYVPPGWDAWRAALQPTIYMNPRFNTDGTVSTYSGGYIADVVTDLADTFIRTKAEPFFLFTSFSAPHAGTPLEADDPQIVYGRSGFPTPNVASRHRNELTDLPLDPGPAFNEADVRDKPKQEPLLAPWEIDAITEVNQQRREALLYVEDAVERIVATLVARGELDNTYLIFTSDNGYMLGEHRIRGGKATPYEEAIGVPLLIRGPGIPAGSVVNQPVGGQDVASTVLAMTGLSDAAGGFAMDGIDLLPLITDPSLYADRPIVLEWGPTDSSGDYEFHGIRTAQWKYVVRKRGAVELYDMVRDPYELDNRANKQKWAAVQAEYDTLLQEYMFCAESTCR